MGTCKFALFVTKVLHLTSNQPPPWSPSPTPPWSPSPLPSPFWRYFFMYKAPRYYFELLLANSSLPESPIERGDYKWANYTKGEPLTFLNTDCFWSDEDCGMNGNSCWTDDMVV
mmetsp:Transcript_15356/g.40586  ORF Transcript_15356/g.40586 Transcript_15356/m.40586 type:complete len:114 (-) Transcript_15356:340-681(-)